MDILTSKKHPQGLVALLQIQKNVYVHSNHTGPLRLGANQLGGHTVDIKVSH